MLHASVTLYYSRESDRLVLYGDTVHGQQWRTVQGEEHRDVAGHGAVAVGRQGLVRGHRQPRGGARARGPRVVHIHVALNNYQSNIYNVPCFG